MEQPYSIETLRRLRNFVVATDDILNRLNTMSYGEKAELLKALVERVTVGDDRSYQIVIALDLHGGVIVKGDSASTITS